MEILFPTILAVCWVLALTSLMDLILRIASIADFKNVSGRRMAKRHVTGVVSHVLITASYWFAICAATYWILS